MFRDKHAANPLATKSHRDRGGWWAHRAVISLSGTLRFAPSSNAYANRQRMRKLGAAYLTQKSPGRLKAERRETRRCSHRCFRNWQINYPSPCHRANPNHSVVRRADAIRHLHREHNRVHCDQQQQPLASCARQPIPLGEKANRYRLAIRAATVKTASSCLRHYYQSAPHANPDGSRNWHR